MKRLRFRKPDYRDKFLILMGICDVILGYAYGGLAHIPHGVRTSLSTATQIMPLSAYGWLWAASGLYCIVAGLLARQTCRFVVAYLMFWLWAALYFAGWLNGDPGRGWVSGSVFLTLSGAVYCVSRLIDPRPIVQPLSQ